MTMCFVISPMHQQHWTWTDYKISLSVSFYMCLSHKRVKRSVHETLHRSQCSTDHHQTWYQGKVSKDVITSCFWWKIGNAEYPCRKWNLFLPLALWKNSFNVKYLENGKRYDVGLKKGQIGNQSWAFDWHYELWPRITLNLKWLDLLFKFGEILVYLWNGSSYKLQIWW